MHGNYYNLHDGFFGLSRFGYGGIIMMFAGLILILVIAYFIFKNAGISQKISGEKESPLELLQKRYVNGDISQDEFMEKKEILKQK
ncbi:MULTISPECIES: SHOCT domain-containing protein [unclassified Oceanispirochaeta]|uniref:SHOCT domain-containing protein n=1 Tax=unclassified Oceanispirochaeta TaxID=2635722 RepID=UPI0013144240|nr:MULTISPECIES: SHOCT domain-containing protein [unclassified Oceanispirochaeta]MBF9018166.1 SHOCT domain-containing protein [Oceanispirochaeta sp. M2]NPD74651.1 hypothetical protein [Oceanispirochaeta sp. M1]